jgi:hypothetical protein
MLPLLLSFQKQELMYCWLLFRWSYSLMVLMGWSYLLLFR